jgi:probable rRNA maturation factor
MNRARTSRARGSRPAPRKGRRPAAVRPQISILIEAPAWRRHVRNVAAVAARAARAALAGERSAGQFEVCLVLADNRDLRRLNRTWRGKDKPTNVLSFPAAQDGMMEPRLPAGVRVPLGDVIIARGVTVAEAKAQKKAVDAHLAHLVVHGVLHLLGHDHERDAEAIRMEALERRILKRIGVDDPYRGMR